MVHVYSNPLPAKGRPLANGENAKLPASCVRSKCSVDVLDTCALCGGKVVRINHNRSGHFSDSMSTGELTLGTSATYDIQCVGGWHKFQSLDTKEHKG